MKVASTVMAAVLLAGCEHGPSRPAPDSGEMIEYESKPGR